MGRAPRGTSTPADVTPPRMAETTPAYTPADTSFVLQAIMQLQKEQGAASAKLDRLIGDVDKMSGKVDKLRQTIAWASGALALLAGILWFIPPAWRQIILSRLFGN